MPSWDEQGRLYLYLYTVLRYVWFASCVSGIFVFTNHACLVFDVNGACVHVVLYRSRPTGLAVACMTSECPINIWESGFLCVLRCLNRVQINLDVDPHKIWGSGAPIIGSRMDIFAIVSGVCKSPQCVLRAVSLGLRRQVHGCLRWKQMRSCSSAPRAGLAHVVLWYQQLLFLLLRFVVTGFLLTLYRFCRSSSWP
jgi:hypothetical protein